MMTISELSEACGLRPRTIRKYISLGMVAPPTGRTSAATYSRRHLVALLEIRKLAAQGRSLGRAKSAVAQGAASSLPGAADVEMDITMMRALRVTTGVVLSSTKRGRGSQRSLRRRWQPPWLESG